MLVAGPEPVKAAPAMIEGRYRRSACGEWCQSWVTVDPGWSTEQRGEIGLETVAVGGGNRGDVGG
jgi:hypothetical protein